MSLERKNRVKDQTTTTGTGTVNLDATAPTGFRTFVSAVTSGATVRYLIESNDKTEWEVGQGVFTDGTPDTLTRVTVYDSSNAGALVNFSAGTKTVSMVLLANDMPTGNVVGDTDTQNLTNKTLTLPIFTNGAINFNAPKGFLINGKIVVTDASGITVAIKTLAGTDPSVTDPVYVRIGDTVRSITAALSVAKADGTNWCNAGSAELATKELDYFAYLGYNATDGVVIGFSRIPGANQYSDFSATTTNEKYCAISTITNAASTDYYEVVGRFAATLSAGAGYTWSVPTFTAKNLIQRPIYETRWNVWVPVFTGFSSAPTSINAKYKVSGDTYSFIMFQGGNGTSNANTFTITSPFSSSQGDFANIQCSNGVDNGVSPANPPYAFITTGTPTITCFKDHNAAVWTTSGNKRIAFLSGFYQI